MTDYVAVANRATTIQEKRYALNARLLPAFGHLPIGNITTGTIDAQVATWVRGGISIKRINNLLTILRRALRCAGEWKLIDRAPYVRHHRYFPPVPQYLTQIESTRLIELMEPGFWRTFILFLLCTGVRFGEAAALRWDDLQLDLDRPLVSIKRGVSEGIVTATKTNASRRTLALIREIAIALRALQYRRPDSEWVFTSPTGKFYRPERTSYILKRACKAACIPIVSWHKLRHSCATQLLMNGVPLTVVKEVLGHTSIEVTSIYTHVTPGLMWDYMHKLSLTGFGRSHGDHRSFSIKWQHKIR
jgi:integrase